MKNDPYLQLVESINEAIAKLSNTIALLAQRTLSTKDYMDFVNEVNSKGDKKNSERKNDLGFPACEDR